MGPGCLLAEMVSHLAQGQPAWSGALVGELGSWERHCVLGAPSIGKCGMIDGSDSVGVKGCRWRPDWEVKSSGSLWGRYTLAFGFLKDHSG